MEKGKTRSIANNYKKLAHWNLPIESYERWLLRLFYLGWIVTILLSLTVLGEVSIPAASYGVFNWNKVVWERYGNPMHPVHKQST